MLHQLGAPRDGTLKGVQEGNLFMKGLSTEVWAQLRETIRVQRCPQD